MKRVPATIGHLPATAGRADSCKENPSAAGRMLAVLEAFLEIHERERTLAGAKARLRPLLGRNATDPDFEVEGVLTVTAVVPPPKLADALALADVQRPDLISARHDIARARAVVEQERRRARPQVAVVPGVSYQNQRAITGFRNGLLFEDRKSVV